MAELTQMQTPSERVFGNKAGTNTCKSPSEEDAGTSSQIPICPKCGSSVIYRAGLRYLADNSSVQRWLCRSCDCRFSDRLIQKSSEWSINSSNTKTSNRQICAVRAKNLDLAAEIKTVAGENPLYVKGKLLQFEFYMQKEGSEESTVEKYGYSMRRLAKISNIDDPESVKEAYYLS